MFTPHVASPHAAVFPAGLRQPQGSARFGMDSLLLPAFAARDFRERPLAGAAPLRAVDLGSGCGIVAFAFLLLVPGVCLGIEREAVLVEAAAANALALGLAGRCAFLHADLNDVEQLASWRGRCDVALANPPWRSLAHGRLSPSELRLRALWATPGTWTAFCRTAELLLTPGGRFYAIVARDGLVTFLNELKRHNFSPRVTREVVPYEEKGAIRFLLACEKGVYDEPFRRRPLVLHERTAGKCMAWSREALDFCPFLARQRGISQ